MWSVGGGRRGEPVERGKAEVVAEVVLGEFFCWGGGRSGYTIKLTSLTSDVDGG